MLRRWRGTAARMEQPPLDHHYLVLHQGGAKRIERRALHAKTTVIADPGAITVVPAGTSYSWTTTGPIGFAHVYLRPDALDRVIIEDFDRDPRRVELTDRLAEPMPLLRALMSEMIEQIETPSFGSRLILSTLLHGLVVSLLSECSTLPANTSPAPHRIAPHRLRNVLAFIDANLADDIDLEDLAAAAGSSRFHFSRAFHAATGFPPYRFLIRRRIETAKALLLEDVLSIAEVAARCGFHSQSQFAAMFRRVTGASPGRFRRDH